MLFLTFHSIGLLKNSMVFMYLTQLTSVMTLNHPDNENINRSEPFEDAASERVEKILNLPVTLNFDDEPLTRRGRGFYGGNRRNDGIEEQKINDGQFGARIILGIVENPHKTTTSTPVPDQKRSQTIVKYFDKEDYGGIKTNPIIVEDHYEEADENFNRRNRKEILDLKQEESPLVDNEGLSQENEEYTDKHKEKDDTNEDTKEPHDVEGSEGNNYDRNRENEEDEEPSEKQKELNEGTNEYNKEHDDRTIQRYEEIKIPSNHKKIYTEVEYPDHYEHTHEKPSEKLKKSKEEILSDEAPSSDYIHHNKEEAEVSDTKEKLTNNDQKESADHSHEGVKKKKENGKHASGKGEEQHEEHHGKKGDKGIKEYEGYHEEVKKKKGHHDEEKHGKKYADKGGEEKKHHEEFGHHGDYHKGEKGEKGSEFSEEGKHSKGHSTKGEHNIHKKDEYEKKQEFYDEHHEGGEHEKHGGFHHEDQYEKGGHKKGGHHKKGDHEDHFGKKSHHREGYFYDDTDGKKKAVGHNQHHNNHSKHGKKSGHTGKKHWGYKKRTGDGVHKKHKEGQQEAAHSNLRQIKKVPPTVSTRFRKDHPQYIGRIHIHNDNRRSDTSENNEESTENQIFNAKNVDVEEKPQNETDFEPTEKKSAEQLDNSYTIGKIDDEHGENVSDYLPQFSIHHERNREFPKNNSRQLPKIYVILPKDFEEQLQESTGRSESSSIERESSYEDSEEQTDPTSRTIHKKYTKVVEPVEAQSFPEEHKERLTEIEYVIHKIGAELGEKLIDKKKSDVKKTKKADTRASEEFMLSGNPDE